MLRPDEELRTFLDEWKVQTCQQVDVAGPTLSQGFFPYHGKLVAKESSQAVRELSGLWLAAGVSPISPDQYAQMLQLLDQAREALRKRDAQALRPPMEQACASTRCTSRLFALLPRSTSSKKTGRLP